MVILFLQSQTFEYLRSLLQVAPLAPYHSFDSFVTWPRRRKGSVDVSSQPG